MGRLGQRPAQRRRRHCATAGGLNDAPDTQPSYEDRAFGGAGLDVLIANTGGDRLIDWVGEFNTYSSRSPRSASARSAASSRRAWRSSSTRCRAADGADPTRLAEAGARPAAQRRAQGEIGLIVQEDPAWGDQTGGPRDPQGPVNGPAARKDVLRSADFNNGTMQAFAARQRHLDGPERRAVGVGDQPDGGRGRRLLRRHVPADLLRDRRPDPGARSRSAGWNANAYVIFDYFSPTDFKFAGIDVSTNKYVMGYRDATGWHVVRQTTVQIKPDTYYNMLVAVNGTAVTVIGRRRTRSSTSSRPQIVDGQPVPLNKGLIGVGSQGAKGTFDNVAVQVLPPQMTLDETETSTTASPSASRCPARRPAPGPSPAAGSAPPRRPSPANIDLMDLGKRINVNNYLELTARLSTTGVAGIVFDHYGATDYKFVALDVPGQRLLIGHAHGSGTWVVDFATPRTLVAGQDYDLQLVLRGAAVSVTLNGAFVVSWGFNAALVDGLFGVIARGGTRVIRQRSRCARTTRRSRAPRRRRPRRRRSRSATRR